MEFIIVTAEDNECDSLHRIAFLKDDSIVVRKQASLNVPLLHKIFENFIGLTVYYILHDFLPVLHVEHAKLEESVDIEQGNDIISIRLNQTAVN